MSVYEQLLTDKDSKTRRETAKDVFEIIGGKAKDDTSSTSSSIPVTPEYMATMIESLRKLGNSQNNKKDE